MSFQLRLIKSNDEFRQLEQVWDNLLSQSPADNYFLSWEWLWNWWQAFARPEDRLAILLIGDGSEVIGIAPFYTRKRLYRGIYPVRRLMFLGTQDSGPGDVCSDYMNIIYRKDEEELVGIIFKTLIRHDICEEVFLAKMDNSSSTFNLFQDHARRNRFLTMIANEYVSPYIRLPLSWDDYLAGLSQSTRYKIRRERRKLDKLDFTVSKAENAGDLMEYYGELVRLHEKRWDSKGIKGAFSNEQFDRFHRGVMPVMLHRGRLELNLLSENGDTKAVIYNIVYKNKIYFYQSGVDTSENKTAFGYALHAHCIEEAIKSGISEYDFLPKGGNDNYKDHFANLRRTVSDIYIARQWALKHLVRTEESARFIYHQIKPYLIRADRVARSVDNVITAGSRNE